MLKERIGSSLIFAVVILLGFWGPHISGGIIITILIAALVFAGVREFLHMTARLRMPGFVWPTSVMAVILVALVSVYGSADKTTWLPVIDGICILTFIAGGFWWICGRPQRTRDDLLRIFVSLFAFLYVGWCLSFVLRLYFLEGLDFSGRYLALMLVAVTKFADVGAYMTGNITSKLKRGNHKLAVRISPNKSWEGLFGGVFAAVLVALLLTRMGGYNLLHIEGVRVMDPVVAGTFGFFAAVFGLLGDLAVSALKRTAGVKDSGTLPGVGGALDLVDSLILVSPVFYLYVIMVVF